MTEFWKEHSKQASVEEMMLDSHARELTKEELPEILSLLPSLSGQRVLGLGTGIGRYTSHLRTTADHVTAVDFMESFVEKNKELNGHHSNTVIMQADVTKLDFPQNRFDVIFSNWLLMYLSDEELRSLTQKMLGWLMPGGFLFFRESCNHQSGDCKRDFNPTHYRTQAEYSHIMTSAAWEDSEASETFGFDIVLTKKIQTYVKALSSVSVLFHQLKNNQNQICWLLQ